MKRLVPGMRILDRYVLLKPLGRGGMGEVWVARHEQLRTEVALKLMTGSTSDITLRRRFEREAQIAAALRSQHIARVIDAGTEDDGNPFIAMELLTGEDLQKKLKREGRLSTVELLRLAEQAGKGLRTAHNSGLVHRDLKPANIFISRQDDEDVYKILDFGIVKVLHGKTAQTATGEILGTPHFMSPEHLRDAASVDHRADLWSFSVILYQCLVGERPFQGGIHDVFSLLTQTPIMLPTLPSAVRSDIGLGVDLFFRRAFATNIADRHTSVDDLLAEFIKSLPKISGTEAPVPNSDSDEAPTVAVARRRSDGLQAPQRSDAQPSPIATAATEEPDRHLRVPASTVEQLKPDRPEKGGGEREVEVPPERPQLQYGASILLLVSLLLIALAVYWLVERRMPWDNSEWLRSEDVSRMCAAPRSNQRIHTLGDATEA